MKIGQLEAELCFLEHRFSVKNVKILPYHPLFTGSWSPIHRFLGLSPVCRLSSFFCSLECRQEKENPMKNEGTNLKRVDLLVEANLKFPDGGKFYIRSPRASDIDGG